MTDLRDRAKSLLANTDVANPAELSDRLLRTAAPSEKEEWLPELMTPWCADLMRSMRNQSHQPAPRVPAKNRSAKRDAIRSWWANFTSQRISVDGEWKTVGLLTAKDLDVVVAERRNESDVLLRKADAYEALGKLLANHGVGRVSELPDSARAAVEEAFA